MTKKSWKDWGSRIGRSVAAEMGSHVPAGSCWISRTTMLPMYGQHKGKNILLRQVMVVRMMAFFMNPSSQNWAVICKKGHTDKATPSLQLSSMWQRYKSQWQAELYQWAQPWEFDDWKREPVAQTVWPWCIGLLSWPWQFGRQMHICTQGRISLTMPHERKDVEV